ncbi:MAG: hypothetical protein RL095_1006 [Verrucomicrobiota bacterium]|jgi:hypothetical protein
MKMVKLYCLLALNLFSCGQFQAPQEKFQVRSLYLNRSYDLQPRIDDKGEYQLEVSPKPSGEVLTLSKDSPEAKLVVMEFLLTLVKDTDLDSHLKVLSIENDLQIREEAPHFSLRLESSTKDHLIYKVYSTYEIVGGITATIESSPSLKERFEKMMEKHRPKDQHITATVLTEMLASAMFEIQDLGHGRCRLVYANPDKVKGARYGVFASESFIAVKRPQAKD